MARRDFVGIYKANTKNTGSVAQFKLGHKRDCMFLELAPQVRPMKDPKPYDWEQKIALKLDISDIAALLALFNGRLSNPKVKLYHQTPNSSKTKIVEIEKQERGYYMKVSEKDGSSEAQRIAIPITVPEAELVNIALRKGYEIMLGW